MAKGKTNKQTPKGVRLKWASLKEVSAVKLSLEFIQGTRVSVNGQFVQRDAGSGKFVSSKSGIRKRRSNDSNKNFLIP